MTFNPRIDHKPNPSIQLNANTEPPKDLAAGKTFDKKLELFIGRVFGPNRPLRCLDNHGHWAHLRYCGDLSTCESDVLTRLVFAAHEFCLRVTIEYSRSDTSHLIIVRDRERTGDRNGHPTLAESLQRLLYAH